MADRSGAGDNGILALLQDRDPQLRVPEEGLAASRQQQAELVVVDRRREGQPALLK